VVWAGFNLEDHWNVGEARSALATHNFDVVVMQQGPSALLESQIDLQLWAKRWADEAPRGWDPNGLVGGLAGVVARECAA
jgi:hypothetical protein